MKSASNLTNLVLLVTVSSLYCSFRYEKDLNDLAQIRIAFADDFIVPYLLSEQDNLILSKGRSVLRDNWLLELKRAAEHPTDWADKITVNGIEWFYITFDESAPIDFGNRPGKFDVTIEEARTKRKWTVTTALEWPVRRLTPDRLRRSETAAAVKNIGYELAINEASDDARKNAKDNWDNYQKAEDAILGHSVDLPGVYVTLPTRFAAWLGFLVVCPLLWFLSDRARLLASISDKEAEREQWILFDAQGWLTKAVSFLWALMLLLSPLILFAQELRITNDYFAAYGASFLGGDIIRRLGSIIAMGGVAWITSGMTLYAWRNMKVYFR